MNAGKVVQGDCLEVLRAMSSDSVDAVVTDPPYELGFMGKKWDASGIAYHVELWAEVLRVLRPGGHLLAFGGTRTSHRMVCAIEDAGFEIRDELCWLYGQGFPKSLNVGKAIDDAAGAKREVVGPRVRVDGKRPGHSALGANATFRASADLSTLTVTAPATPEAAKWEGWGTALKPAHEPICLARKPLEGTVAANVQTHGTGALNVDGCRIEGRERTEYGLATAKRSQGSVYGAPSAAADFDASKGRWPANVTLDEEAAALLDAQSGELSSHDTTPGGNKAATQAGSSWFAGSETIRPPGRGDSGGASRFFYTAKPDSGERNEGLLRHEGERNHHPTVKPVSLMRWLVRLVTPPGGLILDPFAGSGTTGIAAQLEGFRFLGIEREADYVTLANQRLDAVDPLFRWAGGA